MDDSCDNSSSTLVAGFGSPHGDDQAGWRVASLLSARPNLAARVVLVHEATQLVESLAGCRRLIVVDACRSGEAPGTVTRLEWPDPRIEQHHAQSTHGMGVWGALQLAERLQRMPWKVGIYGIEAADCRPGAEMTRAVGEAVVALESEILEHLCREAPCTSGR